jgi:ATP-dependent DNA ligase
MKLPVMPPVSPMLSESVTAIPPSASYEPKWDGFRSILFRDGDEVELGSRNERPLTRYFPELVDAARAELPERCVVDGEIVIAADAGLDFEALQLRLHPAESRVRMLAEQTPAAFIAFCVYGRSMTSPSRWSLRVPIGVADCTIRALAAQIRWLEAA